MSLLKVSINNHYKDRLLNELSNINDVHVKSYDEDKIKKSKENKDLNLNKIKNIRQNLDNLLKKLDITDSNFQDLKFKKDQRFRFNVHNLHELINQTSEEIDFYLNRLIELERYLSKAQIELESLNVVKSSYVYLEQYQLNRDSLSKLNQLNFKVYTTFSKNLENLETLLDFAVIANVHQTDANFPNIYQLVDRSVFYIVYIREDEEILQERMNLIHAEEVPILKKYLTSEGVNFTRINNELNIVNSTIDKYQKEKVKLREQNLLKFAALDEVVQNIEEYNWAEHQFERVSPERSMFKFYIPTNDKKKVEKQLHRVFKEKIIINVLDLPKFKVIEEKERKEETEEDISESELEKEEEEAPTIMKNPWFIKPFEALTKMYGVPSYSEIDPTPFLAVTFPLLFGLMFGDMGHGLILIIAGILGGLIFIKKPNTRNLSWVIFYCGVGALIWGYMYGEFFGTNDFFGIALQPITVPVPLVGNVVFHDPLNNIFSIFMFTLFIGVVHVNLGWTIQFINYWRQSKKYLALTDSLVKISFLTGGAVLIFNYGINLNEWFTIPYPILLVIVPGILLIILKPIGGLIGISYLRTESIRSLLGEGTIETFETGLSVLSNIASYIRLLALALAHIALMISIGALVNLIPEPAAIIPGMEIGELITAIVWTIVRIIGIVLGNVLVIVLEGILVFINTIRLHFYEFFFKFYQGSGTEFYPFFLDEKYSQIYFRIDYEKDLISEEIEKEIETEKIREDIEKATTAIQEQFF